MRDGRTRKIRDKRGPKDAKRILEAFRTTLDVIDGAERGKTIELDRDRIVVGRGPGVHATMADDVMSRQHMLLELTPDGFRVRDLASTNGIAVNGNRVEAALLNHGDHLQAGTHEFEFRQVRRKRER